MKYIIIVSFMITTSILYSQQTVKTGNILRINFLSPEINYNDTLWHWISSQVGNEINREDCINGFSLGSTDYLIINKYEERNYYQMNKVYLYNNTTKTYRFMFEYPPLIDGFIPFLFRMPKFERINDGIWILPGILGKSIFLKNDLIQQGIVDGKLKLVHKVGKIGENYLVVFEGERNFDFSICLVDLSNSPEIKILENVKAYKDGREFRFYPELIHHIKDSTYIIKEELTNVIYLSTFSQNNIYIFKRVKPEGNYIFVGDFTQRFYSKENLYFLQKSTLYKESFDINTNSYIEKDSILFLSGIPFTFNTDSNYMAYYRNDSIFVYSIDKEEIINRQSVTSIKNFIPGIMSPPYIYYHQVKTITGVSGQEELPSEFTLYQNYPNPFNPSTTIEYNIPKVESRHASTLQNVVLKVYDLLGREIATLVDEEKLPGKYRVQFSPGPKLPSGIYFYQCKIGLLTDMKKMIFLK